VLMLSRNWGIPSQKRGTFWATARKLIYEKDCA